VSKKVDNIDYFIIKWNNKQLKEIKKAEEKINKELEESEIENTNLENDQLEYTETVPSNIIESTNDIDDKDIELVNEDSFDKQIFSKE
jgi:hypothetical protein